VIVDAHADESHSPEGQGASCPPGHSKKERPTLATLYAPVQFGATQQVGKALRSAPPCSITPQDSMEQPSSNAVTAPSWFISGRDDKGVLQEQKRQAMIGTLKERQKWVFEVCRDYFKDPCTHHPPPVLLLHGCAGTGKSAAISCIVGEARIQQCDTLRTAYNHINALHIGGCTTASILRLRPGHKETLCGLQATQLEEFREKMMKVRLIVEGLRGVGLDGSCSDEDSDSEEEEEETRDITSDNTSVEDQFFDTSNTGDAESDDDEWIKANVVDVVDDTLTNSAAVCAGNRYAGDTGATGHVLRSDESMFDEESASHVAVGFNGESNEIKKTGSMTDAAMLRPYRSCLPCLKTKTRQQTTSKRPGPFGR